MKRILFFIMDLGGGAGVYCRILARALRQSFPGEFHLSLLVLRERGFAAEDARIFDKIARVETCKWGFAGKLFQIKRRMDKLHPDAVIAVGSFADLVAPLMTRAPVLLTVHGNYSELIKEAKAAWALEPLLKWRFAGGVTVAPSEGVAEDLRENFAAADVRVIPHGIDQKQITELAAASAEGLPGEPYMLAVGRLARQKDYPTMLGAMAIARQRGLEMPLVIVGDGPEERMLRELSEQWGIAGCVRFVSHRENPFAYMRQAEFLVLSSTWEGFGLVLIEAMSLGVPCIATDCPSGPGEILGGGRFGMLVPVGEAEQLAQAMIEMARPETKQKYSEMARQRAGDYTLPAMARAYRKLLNESAIMRR